MANWIIKQLERLIDLLIREVDSINDWFAYWGRVAEGSPVDEKPTWGGAFKYTVGFLIGISVIVWRQVLIAAGDVAILLENFLKGKNR